MSNRNKLLLTFLLFCQLSTLAYAAENLVIYSGRSDKFVKPAVNAFSESTGIKVIVHNAESTALLNKLRLEGERTDADLFLSNDAGNLQKGSDLGLFSPLPENITENIPANYRANDNTWIGLSARARVLVVNTQSKIAQSVQSVFDIAQPQYKDHIGITNSANESFIAGVTVYMLSQGEDATESWLTSIKENAGRNIFNKHSKIVSAVASGRIDIGLVNHYYIYRHLKKHPNAPIRMLIPDQADGGMGIAWNVAGAALSKHSKKTQSALKLLAFFVSAEGQKIFAEVNQEYPTRPGIATAPEIPALTSIKVANIPMFELGKQRDKTIQLLDKVGMP